MNITKSNIIIALGALALLIALFYQTSLVGAALPNFHSKAGTATTTAVGPDTVMTLFTSKDICSSRAITTGGADIRLSFSSSMTPTNAVGHYQLASTTVAYDAELYGCGTVTAHGIASTTLTTTEFIF